MLWLFGPYLLRDGIDFPGAFINWYDDPASFFFTYIVGYAIIWWKPLWGSIIIIIGCIVFYVFNPHNTGFVINFLIATFLVAILNILYWSVIRKKNISDAASCRKFLKYKKEK